MLCEANCFLAGAAWSALRCYAYRLLAAGRHRWAALVVRGMVGLSDVHGLSAGVEEQVRNGAVLRNGAWPEEQE